MHCWLHFLSFCDILHFILGRNDSILCLSTDSRISRYLFLRRGIMRSHLFLEHYVTVIDKNHNRAGNRPNLRQFPNILAASGLLVKSHISVKVKRAPSVLKKNSKFQIRLTPVGDSFKTRYAYVGYPWCTSGARRCTSLKTVCVSCALG